MSPNYRWTCVQDEAAFAPRDGAGALVFQQRMWLLGGWNPDDPTHFPKVCNSEIWSSANGVDWELHGHAPWEPRHTAGYAVHDDAMWIVGGDCNQGHYQNDIWRSEDGQAWDQVSADVPWAPRALHYTVAFDGWIWVIGGQTMPEFAPGAEERFHADVWRTRNGTEWEQVTEQASWMPRGMIGASAVKDGRLWVLGGGTYDTPTTPQRIFYGDAWSTSDGVEWSCHSSNGFPARQYHEVAAWDGRLWVMEGYHVDTGNRNDVWSSADGVTWEELPDTPWAPRHAASVYVFDDALWMVTGNNMTSDAWRLDRI